jgi:hypothetical protein
MKIGFTGTQKGMTEYQKGFVRETLRKKKPSEIHHGDCIGADTDFHNICREVNPDIRIVIHPPEIDSKRSFCKGDEILPVKGYLQRNHDIVDSVDYMISTPGEMEEVLRSGTWATIRYGMKKDKDGIIVTPYK